MRPRCNTCGHYHQDPGGACRATYTTDTGGAARCTCNPQAPDTKDSTS